MQNPESNVQNDLDMIVEEDLQNQQLKVGKKKNCHEQKLFDNILKCYSLESNLFYMLCHSPNGFSMTDMKVIT